MQIARCMRSLPKEKNNLPYAGSTRVKVEVDQLILSGSVYIYLMSPVKEAE